MKRLVLALVLGAVVACGGIAAVLATAGGDSQAAGPRRAAAATSGADPRPHGDFLPVKQPGEPCEMARHASSVAGLETNIPIWAALGEHLTDSWTCGSVPVLMYGGVQVTFENGYAKVDPATKFPRMVASDGGRVETINGRLAYVHPADARGPRNGVWILAGDYSVGVTAQPEVGIARVLQIASEIHIPDSIGR